MSKIKYKKILFAGWCAPEYNLYSFISPKERNVVISESSIWDVSLSGLKGYIKQRIIARMSTALPSGKPHKELFTSLNFDGRISITGGVGLINKGVRRQTRTSNPLRYIYVGRLTSVKNIKFIIEEFNKNGELLTIVGKGHLEEELKAMANDNIAFIGFVNNEELGAIYEQHDVFILPSIYEPWGLVVEEAIYWGLPVIVSSRVGSSIDMVLDLGTGVVFESNNRESLSLSINEMEANYTQYKKAVQEVDFLKRDRSQVKVYSDLLLE